MPNLNLDAARTAVLCMDIQQGTARRSTMFRERNVARTVKSVQEAARKAGVLVIHVAIDYQPAFFSPRNKFIQMVRIPAMSAPGVDIAELLKIVDEVKPAEGEPVVRKPRMNPFFGTPLESMLHSRDIDTVVLTGWQPSSWSRRRHDTRLMPICALSCWRIAALRSPTKPTRL